MVHPRAQVWREKEGSPFRVLVLTWIVMWFGMGRLTENLNHLPIYRVLKSIITQLKSPALETSRCDMLPEWTPSQAGLLTLKLIAGELLRLITKLDGNLRWECDESGGFGFPTFEG